MKKISNEEYRELVRGWQTSGKTKASFAEEAGISRTTFYYWCKKFQEPVLGAVQGSCFSLLENHQFTERSPSVRINYPSGISIEFFGFPDSELVKKLV
jgi:transposase-like protein